MSTGRPSSEERNAAVRATITPLAPDERPGALKVAVAASVLLAIGNVAVHQAPVTLALGAVLLLLAAGMWAREATAVLVFEALLIATMLFAFLGLLSAGNVLAAVSSVLIFSLSGWLFWKLIRVLARIQAPVHDDVPSS